ANAELYLRRGELHRVHRDFALALADFARAEALEPAVEGVDLCRGRALVDADRFPEAMAALDRVLASHPASAEALALRARAEAAAGDKGRAAALYARAIAAETRPQPDL